MVTYPAGAVFSLVDGPYLKGCKCAKMNRTLTATYSRWKAGVDEFFIHQSRDRKNPKKQTRSEFSRSINGGGVADRLGLKWIQYIQIQ